ncbi:MAG: hypothetical protein Kow0029_11480 [Candidatus Rifleibacteriota bacterium]
MTLKNLVLISLLAACGALGILTTNIFHSLVPLPGFGALIFQPLSFACLIIARGKTGYGAAAGLTKLIQNFIILFLPGGPMLTKNPLMIPLMSIDGFLIDIVHQIFPFKLAEKRLLCALLTGICGSLGLILQTTIMFYFVGKEYFMLSHGFYFFVVVFILFHGILKAIGGALGSAILKAVPDKIA